MKTKIILGIIIISIFLFAVLLNPSKEMHVHKISDLIEKPFNDSNPDSTLRLMDEMMFENLVGREVEYKNYWFYSVGYYTTGLSSKTQSFGVFGRVFIISK